MKPSTVVQVRASLRLAALAATLIQAVVFIAVSIVGIPEKVFESAAFRIGVVVAVGVTLLLARFVPRLARRRLRPAVP